MAYNFERTKGNDLVPDGDYEIIIEKITEQVTPNGKEKLQVQYRVRDDIDGQRYGRKCIFESIWKEKDGKHYNQKRINMLLSSIPEEELKSGTDLDSINDVIKLLTGRMAKAHIETEYNEYYEKDENIIKYFNVSEHLPQTLGGTTKTVATPDVNDDELPF